ncbi:MAG: PKD domain-containing protein [bacterium]
MRREFLIISVLSVFFVSSAISLSGSFHPALAQCPEYLAIWSSDLRIFAQQPDTRVKLIDIDTGTPLSLTDPRIANCNIATNPFILSKAGDSFEGIAENAQIRVKIVATDISGRGKLKPLTVWTGSLSSQYRHPGPDINAAELEETPNPWMAFLPACTKDLSTLPSKIGQEFIGFTTAEMYIFAQKKSSATRIVIEDMKTNTDSDSDDTIMLDANSPYCTYKDNTVQIFYVNIFDDDTVRISGNTKMAVLAGLGSQSSPDWAVSVPAFDTGQESGMEFYTFAHDQLMVFPMQDNTIVSLIDCSDYDDSRVCTLVNGSLTNTSYDLLAISKSSTGSGRIIPRSGNPKVNIIPASLNNNVFDNDLIKITATKPVLVQAGGSINDRSFLDVAATSMDTNDSKTYLTYAYVPGCGSSTDRNVHIFGYDATTRFSITSLSFTGSSASFGHHDIDLDADSINADFPQNSWTSGTLDGEVLWASGDFCGEALRITSNKPLLIFTGSESTPNSGTFVPCQPAIFPLPPAAVIESAGGGSFLSPVVFDASGSYDRDSIPGKKLAYYCWDFDISLDTDDDGITDNDADSFMPTVTHSYPRTGSYTARLTFSDDDGQVGFATVHITVGEDGLKSHDALITLLPSAPEAGSAVTATVEIPLPDVSYHISFGQMTQEDNTFKISVELTPPPSSSTYHPGMTIQQRYTYFLGDLEEGDYLVEVYEGAIQDENVLASKSFSVKASSSSSSASSSYLLNTWPYYTSSGGYSGYYTSPPLSTPPVFSIGTTSPSYTVWTSPLANPSLSTRSASSISLWPSSYSSGFPVVSYPVNSWSTPSLSYYSGGSILTPYRSTGSLLQPYYRSSFVSMSWY